MGELCLEQVDSRILPQFKADHISLSDSNFLQDLDFGACPPRKSLQSKEALSQQGLVPNWSECLLLLSFLKLSGCCLSECLPVWDSLKTARNASKWS